MKYHKLAILESQRISLIHKLSSLTADNLNFKFSDDQWNVLEVIEHIIVSEELSLQYVTKKLKKPEKLVKVPLKSTVLTAVVNFVLKFKIKVKAPKVTEPSSNSDLSIADLATRWEKSRANLEKLSEESSVLLKKGVFKHPKIGVMNFEQMVAFFCAHKRHHLLQINTLLEAKEVAGESLQFSEVPVGNKQTNLGSI